MEVSFISQFSSREISRGPKPTDAGEHNFTDFTPCSLLQSEIYEKVII